MTVSRGSWSYPSPPITGSPLCAATTPPIRHVGLPGRLCGSSTATELDDICVRTSAGQCLHHHLEVVQRHLIGRRTAFFISNGTGHDNS
ncbi:hypothetical protein MX572_11580 [Rhodococcus pyridinivorans]|uniref:hypothetical protein n=1 Tax=Rhodococcus pyridinivorans TaxID=103816 RepID=UPI00110DD1C1|nr:hypothetical protein [Rhodococcus pyridinivorans]UTM39318.1 hypothetical protein MX572_11580 [Rhodococcus pyridinivorans]